MKYRVSEFELPGSIERILLDPKGVFIWGDAQELRNSCLDFQGTKYPIEPAKDVLADPSDVAFHATLPLGADQVHGHERISGKPARLTARVNHHEAWTLAGKDTLQISVDAHRSALNISVLPGVNVPAHDTPLLLEALVAVHHCAADLVVSVSSLSGEAAKKIVPLDPARPGGREANGYQTVRVVIPPSDAPNIVALNVDYAHSVGLTDPNVPFIFIADAKIRSAGAQKDDRNLDLVGDLVDGAECHYCPLPLGVSRPGNQVILVTPSANLELFGARDATVTLLEDHGHSLILQASVEQEYTLHFAGKNEVSVTIATTPTTIRLPASLLTGEFVHFAVKDRWGLQSFLETHLLTPRTLTPQDVLHRESRAPFPQHISNQAAHRYQGMKAHLAHTKDAQILGQLSGALETLEGGYENVRLNPLRLPKPAKPDVSVIIPAHNKVEVTYLALCGLLLAHNRASFEVILVDDASSDETREIETIVKGLTVVRNATPQRFIRACNAGVARARGKYVVLLNNDTEPTAGWLDALIDAFDRFDDVGLVGSKLLYPNGQLQDGGGLIWKTGNPWNYGNRQNPWEPRFCYARQVDYLCGAAMMTTRAIWDALGGLSSYLEPMYFEDTDFSFKVREAGLKTYFIPSSIVYHYEGMTSGTDTGSGFKRHQEENRPKFKKRWAGAFTNFGAEGVNPDLEKDRGIVGRVLFIDYTTPRADRDAGSYAAIQEMRLVQSLGYKVTFIAQNLAHFGAYTEALEKMGVEFICAPFVLSVDEFLSARGREFDAFYITRFHVAQQVLRRIRETAPEAKILFNNADLHFLRELRAAKSENDPTRLTLARATRDQELDIIRKVDVVLSYNPVEHAVIESHTDGEANVVTAPWVVDTPSEVPPLKARAGLSFLGNYQHHPNAEAAIWFVRDILPQIRHETPDATLSIYGAGMTQEIRALAGAAVTTPGFVDDISDAYHPHRVFVAPLLSGAGIKGKVLAAMAHGIPTVLSPIAAEGVGLRHGHDCMIAATPLDWVNAVSRLCDEDAFWQKISDNGRKYVQDRYSFAAGRALMREAFEAVGMYGASA